MLTRAYNLRQVSCSTPLKLLSHQYSSFQPINLFVGSADELFGPITTIRGSRDGQVAKSIPWTAFSLLPADWEHVKDMRAIISDANNVQQCFSAEQHPTLWRVVPVLEELQTSWEGKRADPRYEPYHLAIDRGLAKIGKYYNRLDDKPVYILALGRSTAVIYQQ